jgi:hypothetical protein
MLFLAPGTRVLRTAPLTAGGGPSPAGRVHIGGAR